MGNYHTFTIENSFCELELLCAEVNEIAADNKFSEQLIFCLNVCLEEMLTNIIKYAYDDEARHKIEIRMEVANEIITLTIIDDGHEFNPLEMEKPDTTLDLQHREIGGIGIFLTCQMANKIVYERKGDRNYLRIFLTPHVVML
ncbi:MAG: ATP-binding protein [Victivallales bacterium]|nr:ATP-binding protein [Victivallales bacterium]